MVGYCVEYVVWYMEKSEWKSRTEYFLCLSLADAEREAQSLNWNEAVEEGSVHIRLMTEKEYKAVSLIA